MNEQNPPMKGLSVRLPHDMLYDLDNLASHRGGSRYGQTIPTLIRTAVAEWLEEQPEIEEIRNGG